MLVNSQLVHGIVLTVVGQNLNCRLHARAGIFSMLTFQLRLVTQDLRFYNVGDPQPSLDGCTELVEHYEHLWATWESAGSPPLSEFDPTAHWEGCDVYVRDSDDHVYYYFDEEVGWILDEGARETINGDWVSIES